ncbi:hypothetical protein QYE76_035652 [Lolium multiflorum]|uniref:DUF4283 domain-containing protein n=1 Tax=Lolium multiflorum TaxID=4521 RepID=A0AAD8R217_LOLMU|nr:hypothetical protein QYE76_035652 [Lolium multiflorum]
MQSNWIPLSTIQRPLGYKLAECPAKVQELILPTGGVWNEDKLREHFYDHDVSDILRTPIGKAGSADFQAWNYTKNGVFSRRKLDPPFLERSSLRYGVENCKGKCSSSLRGSTKEVEVPKSAAVFDNPLFAYDPGLDRNQARARPIASARNGGDQGGADEAPTRPKLLAGGAFVPPRGQGTQVAFDYEIRESSNWHAAQREGLAGADEYLDGVVDMEEEDIIELEPEEEEPTPAEMQRWRLRGRYISVKKPNIEDMTDHFNDVWHLRTGVNFAPLGKNWFTVTLFSEGDYKFVARGGPWIYRGYPLLVGKIEEGARPSETLLNSVPLWVQVYDVPWNRQKKSTAQLIGAKLGKYLEADLDADGRSPYDFLRVRIDIPVDRRLKPSITTQGTSGQRIKKKIAVRTGRGKKTEHECLDQAIIETVQPIAMYPAYPSASFLAGLGSEEMIPPLRGLSSLVFSAGDTFMSEADSILGKRGPDLEEGESEDRSKAMVALGEASPEGKQKRGRCEPSMGSRMRGVDVMEAISHGAADQLTGTHGAPRQQQ